MLSQLKRNSLRVRPTIIDSIDACGRKLALKTKFENGFLYSMQGNDQTFTVVIVAPGLKMNLRADQLVYIGLRDIDPYEAYILNRLGIRAYAMDSVDKYGISKIMEMTLDALDVKNKIHVSFDVDALDCKVAPSTGTAVFGGLSLREGIYIVEALSETKRVQGIDLVELNPLLGTPQDVQTTVSASLQILKTLCGGYRRKGNFNNIDESLVNISENKK